MEYTMEERAARIRDACLAESSRDPLAVFRRLAEQDFVRMHGPEHHVLDGACLLMAFYNAGGRIDLPAALDRILAEGLRMPGAVCGLWGVCGAVMSIGAALAVIDGTGPLSADGTWGSHMRYTSAALGRLAAELETLQSPLEDRRDRRPPLLQAGRVCRPGNGRRLYPGGVPHFPPLWLRCLRIFRAEPAVPGRTVPLSRTKGKSRLKSKRWSLAALVSDGTLIRRQNENRRMLLYERMIQANEKTGL